MTSRTTPGAGGQAAVGDEWGLHELTRAECLALLPSVPVGRLVYTAQALPAIIPVTFCLLAGSIVFRTGPGTGLRATQEGVVVAFEADDVDPAGRAGWSVVVLGRAVEVTGPGWLRRVAELPLLPWAAGPRSHVVRIPLELVSGRRVGFGVAHRPERR